MKIRIPYRLTACIIAALATVSCIKNDFSFSASKSEGELDLASIRMDFEQALEITTSRASEINTDNFTIEIYDTENVLRGSWIYSQLPERITLPVGSYTLKVASCEAADAAWDAPCYGTEKTFIIEKDRITALGTLTCSLLNIMVSVSYDEKLFSMLSDDSKVVITIGKGELTFAKGETHIGYFKAEAENTLTAEFSGKIDGEYYAETKVIDNVKAGQHQKLKYSVKENPTPDSPEGGADFKFSIDLTYQTIDINKNIDITEDVIPDPDEDKKPEGEDKGAPAIEWVGGDIDTQYTLTTTDTTEVKIPISILAPNGISGFTVDIESTAAAFSKESLNDLGLDTHLDFINPGEMKEGLESLGFQTGGDVLGKTKMTFNITTFIPLFVVANNETVDFTLTITDAYGHTTPKKLMLKIQL